MTLQNHCVCCLLTTDNKIQRMAKKTTTINYRTVTYLTLCLDVVINMLRLHLKIAKMKISGIQYQSVTVTFSSSYNILCQTFEMTGTSTEF